LHVKLFTNHNGLPDHLARFSVCRCGAGKYPA
jgi:hypothetical protein